MPSPRSVRNLRTPPSAARTSMSSLGPDLLGWALSEINRLQKVACPLFSADEQAGELGVRVGLVVGEKARVLVQADSHCPLGMHADEGGLQGSQDVLAEGLGRS